MWSIPLLLSATLVLFSGCAKPDWIQQTLVTADVTGVWVGTMGNSWVSAGVRFELEQEGAKVKGFIQPEMTSMSMGWLVKGPIDGTVSGDVFRFKQTNAALMGEMTVSGDEMRGQVTIGRPGTIFLRRVDSSPRPAAK